MTEKKSIPDTPEEKGKRTELEERLARAIRIQEIGQSAGMETKSKSFEEDDKLAKDFRQIARLATGIEDELNKHRIYEADEAIEENRLPSVFLYKAAYVENKLGTLEFNIVVPATSQVNSEELTAISLHFSQFLNNNGYDREYKPEDFSAVEFENIRNRFCIKSKHARMNKSASPDYRVEQAHRGTKSVVVIEKMPSCDHDAVILYNYVKHIKQLQLKKY